MTYFQDHSDLVLNSLGVGASTALAIVDNSTLLSNNVVNFRKLTMSWYSLLATDTAVLWAITRETQGTTAPVLLTDSIVRNLRNENHLIRGPSYMPSRPDSHDTNWRKTVVLKNITLDQDDDLRLVVTNVDTAFASTGNKVHVFLKGWYRVVS